jgi:hypothetical protein
VTKTLTAVTSAACWQAYLAPTAALIGTGGSATTMSSMSLMADTMFVPVVPVLAAAPFTAFASTTAAAGHVQAVAGVEFKTTAPKQADKPSVTRNDANPDRFRPGAPPS